MISLFFILFIFVLLNENSDRQSKWMFSVVKSIIDSLGDKSLFPDRKWSQLEFNSHKRFFSDFVSLLTFTWTVNRTYSTITSASIEAMDRYWVIVDKSLLWSVGILKYFPVINNGDLSMDLTTISHAVWPQTDHSHYLAMISVYRQQAIKSGKTNRSFPIKPHNILVCQPFLYLVHFYFIGRRYNAVRY